MGARLAAREDRRLGRLHGDDPDALVPAAQALAGAAQRPRGADALDEAVDASARLAPDLLRHPLVGGELVGVVELVRPVAAGLLRQDPGGLDHLPGQLLRHPPVVAGDDLEPGPQQLHVIELLPREGVRGDDAQGIPLDRADEGQGDAGAAAGVLDDRATGPQAPVRLRRLDHGQRHPVLHAAGGVPGLQLQQDARAVPRHDLP